jgi:hypothetical protein
MRFVMIAALSVLAAVATISVACAQNDQGVSSPPNPAPTTVPGPTVTQESTIPYQPCREALGWVNGRLKCDNRY